METTSKVVHIDGEKWDWKRSMLQTSERGGGGLLVKLRPAWAQMAMAVRKYFKVKTLFML